MRSGTPPGTAASPPASLPNSGAFCSQHSLGGTLLGWDPLVTLHQKLHFICLPIWGTHAHTWICLGREHALAQMRFREHTTGSWVL